MKWGGFLYGHRCCGRCAGHLNGIPYLKIIIKIKNKLVTAIF
jgi:hypothetical protein